MTRTTYLIAYDISDPKRLARVHRIVEGFAVGGQKSLYECWITAHELQALKADLDHVIAREEDRVYFFQLFENNARYFYGKAKTQSVQPFLFV